MQSGFFLPESGKSNERKGGRSLLTLVQNPGLAQNPVRRKRSQSQNTGEFLLSYFECFVFVFTMVKIFLSFCPSFRV